MSTRASVQHSSQKAELYRHACNDRGSNQKGHVPHLMLVKVLVTRDLGCIESEDSAVLCMNVFPFHTQLACRNVTPSLALPADRHSCFATSTARKS